ncbi:MAG TPA: tetratricopeptide repeat protein [Sphingomicrobium sp.]|nr:tetratricopeptide repeat protein [Sphingomicrobium sp.]
MKLTRTALALALSSGMFSSAAVAQYGSQQPSPSTSQPAAQASGQAQEAGKKPTISNSARKEIVALQTAVNAKNAAAIPAAIAAAKAKAKSKDDHYTIAQLQLKAAADANDNAAMVAGLQEVLNSGFLDASETLPLHMNLGKLQYNAKSYDAAAAAFEQVIKADPSNIEATVLLAETRSAQGRTADAVGMIQKAIATKNSAGQKADEAWYKRAVALSFNAKLPSATGLARDWVAAYPSPKNWRDAIRIYQTSSQLDDAALVDSMRLARATGALQGENDYFRYTNSLVTKGFPGEAKAVLDEGFAAKAIDRSRATFSQLYSAATQRAQGDRASLGAAATAAKSAADAKKAMTTAEAYYGYGDYREAAELLQLALTKSGVDKDLANLRLGMALAQAGDKAGATAALNAAGGAQSDVAKLWLTYLATKA